jgi:hypothetical protein
MSPQIFWKLLHTAAFWRLIASKKPVSTGTSKIVESPVKKMFLFFFFNKMLSRNCCSYAESTTGCFGKKYKLDTYVVVKKLMMCQHHLVCRPSAKNLLGNVFKCTF